MKTPTPPDPAPTPCMLSTPLEEMRVRLNARFRAMGITVTERASLQPGQLIATFPGKRPLPPPNPMSPIK